MTDIINRWLAAHRRVAYVGGGSPPRVHYVLRPRMILADGWKLSIQAGHAHYCTPRDDDGPYTTVEVDALEPPHHDCQVSNLADELTPWQGDPDAGIYGYVPVENLAALVEKHGCFIDAEKYHDS